MTLFDMQRMQRYFLGWNMLSYNKFSEDIESAQKKSGKYKKMLNRTISLTQISN